MRLLLALFFAAATAYAAHPSTKRTLVYGGDDRRVIYGRTESSRSVCVLVELSEMRPSWMGYVEVQSSRLTSVGDKPICKDERFYGGQSIGFCTGFLVSTGLVATAAHCISNLADCQQVGFIFGYQAYSRGPRRLRQHLHRNGFPHRDVYICTAVHRLGDISLVQLDRHARRPALTLSSSTDSELVGSRVRVLGHPLGLPLQEAWGTVQQTTSENLQVYASLDTFQVGF